MHPTLEGTLADRLAAELGPGSVLVAPHELALYGYDGVIETAPPACVALPETTAQVAAVVRLAAEAGLPVTPRGGGTSLSGGPAPVAGGVVVSLTRMDRILELDLPNQRAVVQPGVINQDLISALQPRGFLFAPDPSSQSVCTLGGNVAENSGGPHCLKYGVTTNHVTGLEVVLADGRVLRTGGKAGGWPGYDLTGVVVGSEGTFGIVTEITCRIMPLPQAVQTMLAVFDSLEAASRTVSDIIAAGLLPATLEMMDRPMIEAVQQAMDAGYPLGAEAVLIIELDGLSAGMEAQVTRIRVVCEGNGVRDFQWAQEARDRDRLWKGRKGAFAAAANLAPGRLCTDVAVPRSELPAVLARVMEIGREHGLLIGNVFHAGDGNLHPQVLYDPLDAAQVAHVKQVDEAITRLAIEHGGVLTGEHGIGACKRKWMPLMFTPADLRALAALKSTFDPAGVMNPGKVLPDAAADPAAPTVSCCGELEPGTFWFPTRLDDLVGLMTEASRARRPVWVTGGSHGPVPEGRVAISTARLPRVLEADAANLTLTASAGVTWDAVEAAAAACGQRVPVAPARPEATTVGGLLARGVNGPLALRFGGLRDLLTGARLVTAGGEMVRMGSRCVKNTSGYALEKLLIGSQGTLAVLTECTFRTVPIPQATTTFCFTAGPGLAEFCAGALGGELLPSALEVFSPGLAAELWPGRSEWMVAVALEGLAEEVAALRESFLALAAAHGLELCGELTGEAESALWAGCQDLGPATLLASAPLSRTVALGVALAELVGEGARLRVSPGQGLCYAAGRCTGEAATELAARAQALAAKAGGAARWLAPLPRGARNPAADPLVAEFCARLKSALDPAGVLPELA